jgi:hypothetical protein
MDASLECHYAFSADKTGDSLKASGKTPPMLA